jgi:hypothetical protein
MELRGAYVRVFSQYFDKQTMALAMIQKKQTKNCVFSINALPDDVLCNIWAMHGPLPLTSVSKAWKQQISELLEHLPVTVYVGFTESKCGYLMSLRMLMLGVVQVINLTYGHLGRVLKYDSDLKKSFTTWQCHEEECYTLVHPKLGKRIDRLHLEQDREPGWYNNNWKSICAKVQEFQRQDYQKDRTQTLIKNKIMESCFITPDNIITRSINALDVGETIDLTTDDSDSEPINCFTSDSDSDSDNHSSKRVKYNIIDLS